MEGIPVVPPGLEYLLQMNHILIKQTRSAFQNYLTYDILTPDGGLMYRAEQEMDCCGPRLDVRIRNYQNYEVFNLLIPSTCGWDNQLQVFSPPGTILGYIEKEWASMTSSFTILTPDGQLSLKVKGPGWGGGFMSDANFEVKMYDSSANLGVITRVWRGLGREMISPNDHYSIQCALDLDVKVKALLIACAIFIDFLCYEQRKNK
ncbi:phospholipid scramblase 3-like isoform 1-T3 [Discoglossus pictus]